MAIGAIAALKSAGRKPGEDVILVSIDGENAALDAIVDGKLGASVESSPFFGPIAYETMMQYVDGEDIPDWVKSRTASSTRQRRRVPGQAVLERLLSPARRRRRRPAAASARLRCRGSDPQRP